MEFLFGAPCMSSGSPTLPCAATATPGTPACTFRHTLPGTLGGRPHSPVPLTRESEKTWVWALTGSVVENMPKLTHISTVKGFGLWATVAACMALSTVQHRQLHFFRIWNMPPATPRISTKESIFHALMCQIKCVLHDTSLGRWAKLMPASVPYWPYSTLPSLRTVRCKAHTNAWYVHVQPPEYVIYVCVNLRKGSMLDKQPTVPYNDSRNIT